VIEVETTTLVLILATATKVEVGAAVVGVTVTFATPEASVNEVAEATETGPVKDQETSSPETGLPLAARTVATISIGDR
jgi:hypothetical protein